MNRSDLKDYAPRARRDFIQAMKDRAAFYGLTASKVESVVERGDALVIAGREHPRAVGRKRKALEERIRRNGFDQTMEAMAYTWFNRLVAIRFMELHGYLDHGYRVLSHPDGKPTPEILEHADAEQVNLPGLKRDRVIDLMQAGDKDSELYRMLLTAQCNALHAAMPFLFERIDDETELLLPDNLLHSDSLIRKLTSEIDEADWKEVEIIGWIYQFYISEKKARVIGKVVASEDIPAATQLFTPNWIVKYLVQNTLGRQWLATYPNSALRQKMEYYIEPAEQTQEVQDRLRAITPASLNPEELTLLDPACGSGHILVEAYDLFKAIYEERGYRAKEIPALILQRNLFGLEIDDRAAQLAAFALMMKARADDRRIFDNDVKPNVIAFVESKGLDAASITNALNAPTDKEEAPREYLFEEIEDAETPLLSRRVLAEKGHVSQGDIASLLALFQNAKTLGSLIQVPQNFTMRLPQIERRFDEVMKNGNLTHIAARNIEPLLREATLLVKQYDAVVANPPYMGHKGMNSLLKEFGKTHYRDNKADIFNMFMERGLIFGHANGLMGLMTPFTWMFISSYQKIREHIFSKNTLLSLIQPEYHAFFESAYVPICAFVVNRHCLPEFQGTFIDLSSFYGESEQPIRTLEAINDEQCVWRYKSSGSDFRKITGSPVAYWVSPRVRDVFAAAIPMGEIAEPRQGMATADNDRFLRRWYEVEHGRIGFALPNSQVARKSGKKWFPYNKGGEYRKWYGNNEYVVNWEDDGKELKSFKPKAVIRNPDYYFRPSITWSFVSSSYFGVRISDEGFIFDVGGSCVYPSKSMMIVFTGFMCSIVVFKFMRILNPTLNFQVGNVSALPILKREINQIQTQIDLIVEEAVQIARDDWDSQETSWSFRLPVIIDSSESSRISDAYEETCKYYGLSRTRMKTLEEDNNRLFIGAYGLQDELSPQVPDDQITLYQPNREEDAKRLLSYAIGCMMGRYSLNEPGLIYAQSGNRGFDLGRYKKFSADDDGIVPLYETDWGVRDDAANHVFDFVGVAWPKENLEENLKFIADSLGPTNGQQPRETIRRYLATGFYKHHLAMYKKRPVYWLFSSGKQRAFQCLVYLHRYHEGTLARMRTEYVIPLQGQIAARIDQIEGDKAKATSTSHRKRLQKEQDEFKKQQAELAVFEEKLKHAADQKIALDLDDGVKVNYGKFGDLVAEAKAITGEKDDE